MLNLFVTAGVAEQCAASTTRYLKASLPSLLFCLGLVACTDQRPDLANSEFSDVESSESHSHDPVMNFAGSGVMVIAHRACWRGSAENSLHAIEQCVKLGVDMVEIDVRRTADGYLVLMHDETIDRTTTGRGDVLAMSLDELKIVRLRGELGGEGVVPFTEGIPTLQEALELTRGRILVNLDIKEDVFDQSIALVESMGLSNQVLIKSSKAPNDPVLNEQLSKSKTLFMPIIRECDDRPNRVCSRLLSEAVPTYGQFNPIAVEIVYFSDGYLAEGIATAKSGDLRVWVNTLGERFAAGKTDDKALVNPDNNWGSLIDIGVDMIQTDRPAALITYLETRGLRSER